ncbi:MAG: CRISPR-associated endonuclease Cas3'', partial [Oscillospiraceae bacterium]|nr:CRISPR-associated endonuclease Cas3'' [Oscillospiraceae bacterium]
MIAHIRKKDNVTQPAEKHCENVGKLAAERGRFSGMEKSALLAGILHDMGKFTNQFEKYISGQKDNESNEGKVYHSPTGAIFAYDRWYVGKSVKEQRAAQIISMVIRGHQGGLIDCIDANGDLPYLAC